MITFNDDEVAGMLDVHRNGRTLTALADEIGVSRSYLHQIMRGIRPPNRRVLDFLGLERHVNRSVIYTYKNNGN